MPQLPKKRSMSARTDSDRILWLAVINLALDDLIATKDPLKRSALAWFLSID
jgi:hypothetical protein